MLPEDFGVIPDLDPYPFEFRLLVSLALIALVLSLRWAVRRIFGVGSAVLSDRRRWWTITLRNLLNAAIVIGLFVVWSSEIEEFALSITAIAVAVAIATKELLLCLSGSIWLSATRAFDVGDWVEIGDHSGEVVDATVLVTVLQEIEPREYRYTGRTVSVPNALLLSQRVVNHNFRKRFLHHEFWLYTEPAADGLRVRAAIEDALAAAAAEFADVAQRYAGVIEKRAGFKLPAVPPRVCIQTTETAKMAYRCMLFCPRDQAGALEQVAARALLEAGGVRAVGQQAQTAA